MTLTAGRSSVDAKGQKAGGAAALYLAVALLAAIPYFLLVVDYPGASTAADRVALIEDHYVSLYAIYLISYVFFGLALGVLVLALWERLHTVAPFTLRVATAVGLMWSVALVASGLIFTYGMTTIHDLARTDYAQAVLVWQALEPVAMGLGGAGGEVLGGLWVLLLSVVVVRGADLPKALGWLGVVIGVTGLASALPPLQDATVAFGLLEIAWLAWLGGLLLTTKVAAAPARLRTPTDVRELSMTEIAR
jgi:hypothetical protein